MTASRLFSVVSRVAREQQTAVSRCPVLRCPAIVFFTHTILTHSIHQDDNPWYTCPLVDDSATESRLTRLQNSAAP